MKIVPMACKFILKHDFFSKNFKIQQQWTAS